MSSVDSDSTAALSENQHGVFAALKFFVAVVYEETFAYQTIKLVRTYDWRLSLMKRVFTTGVLLYIIFFIVLFHGYVFFEAPTVVINPNIARNNSKMLPFENSTAAFLEDVSQVPDYCFGTNYIFTPGVLEFINNYCINYLSYPEFTAVRTASVGVTTYARQEDFQITDCKLYMSREEALENRCA
eukprot:5873389-Pyramimonas_sp.AAC.1